MIHFSVSSLFGSSSLFNFINNNIDKIYGSLLFRVIIFNKIEVLKIKERPSCKMGL